MKVPFFYVLSLCFLVKEFKCQVGRNPGRIIGGTDAELSLAPYIVSLQLTENNFGHMCGGSLVTLRHVLTAAHCFANMDEEAVRQLIKVVHDVLSIAGKGSPIRQTRNCANLIVHSEYEHTSYDIAMIKVTKPFSKDGLTKTINLAKEEYPDGQKCVIFGWGFLNNTIEKPAKKLKMAVITIDGLLSCTLIVPSTEICAGNFGPGPDACKGDSGGPLVCNNMLVGVVSRGVVPCAQKLVGTVFTKVSYYRDWIQRNIADQDWHRKVYYRRNKSPAPKFARNNLFLYLAFYSQVMINFKYFH